MLKEAHLSGFFAKLKNTQFLVSIRQTNAPS